MATAVDDSFCVVCWISKVDSNMLRLKCNHKVCLECSQSCGSITCPLDQAIDDRTAEQRVFLQREANQDSPSLTEMIRYLVESIRTTETRREEVLTTIETDSDFMLQRLQSREAELQGCLLDSARAKTDAILAGQHKSIPPPVSLKSPLLYTFFPGAGTVGAWNQVEYTACDEFNNVSYLLKPKCCMKAYCCFKCHDKREGHSWKNAIETICLYCDAVQPYKTLPNHCAQCKAYHSAMNSKSK